MRLRLLVPHYHGSRPGLTVSWFQGEERDLADDVARYVLDTFPGMAEVVDGGGSVAEVVSEPPADRAMKAPRRRVV